MGRPFPRRSDYVRMLECYKEDLEAELEEVNEELADLKQGKDSE
jgi:ribosomal protein L29